MSRKHSLTAIIYDKKGRVLSVGQNSYTKTHPKMAHLGRLVGQADRIFLHAEIAALVKCRGVPYKIKIERFDKYGNPKLAKPCPICELAIIEAGVKVVDYTL
jgi:tRNA(Arg) A34 adenosine deaminase TadA